MFTNQKKDNEKKNGLFILLFFFLAAANIVFITLCLHNVEKTFFTKNFHWLALLSSFLIILLCLLAIWLHFTQKESWSKLILSLFIFLLFLLILLFILQKTGFFKVIKNSDSLQEYLEKSGAWMPILYMVLQYLQVIVLPIPSVVSTLAGVALFGATKAMLYSLIGIILGSFSAFFIGRKLGNKAVAWMVGEDNLKKWQKKLKGKDNLILTLMFLLPIFPDDILCFVAGLSSMSTKYFFFMILISRALAISLTCYSIDLIPFNTWWGLCIWGIFIIGLIALFILIYKNLDKIQNFVSKKFRFGKK